MITLRSHVAGIPCLIEVTEWEPFVRGRYYGPPEDCYPDEGGFGCWEVLDQRGRPAPWLSRKLTNEDTLRIDKEVFDFMETHRRTKDYA